MTAHPEAVEIRLATPQDVPLVTITLVTAFQDTPDAAYLVPDLRERERVYVRFCGGLLEQAVAAGWVHITNDHTAVAVWQPPDALQPDAEEYHAFLASVCGPYADRFRTLDKLIRAVRPATPHHLLDHLAVMPARQGRGLGSAMLRAQHARLDAAGEPAFLVAVSSAARRLYARHGYVTRQVFELPDGQPLWAMWREPQPNTAGPGPAAAVGR
jgi:predicted N-acetyltransferase YhbS